MREKKPVISNTDRPSPEYECGEKKLVMWAASFVSKIDQNLIFSDTPITLNILREIIKSVFEILRTGKVCGIDKISTVFLLA
jgi:hypothetical protein